MGKENRKASVLDALFRGLSRDLISRKSFRMLGEYDKRNQRESVKGGIKNMRKRTYPIQEASKFEKLSLVG